MSESVALITGASRGIGRALAEHYVDQGWQVIGCGRSDHEPSASYAYLKADVTDEADARHLFKEIKRQYGRLDLLVNNAGGASMNHSLLTPTSSFDKLLRLNTLATFTMSREAAKLMRRNKYGRIINFTTVAVPLQLEGEAAYVASKAGVESLTKVMARELAEFGITVNAVGPVPIKTDLIRGVPQEKLDDLLTRQAISRYGTFSDVCNVVDFFAQPASDFVTGQVIYLGGVS